MNTTKTEPGSEVLRGYEVVNGFGVSVMKFKPTIWGAKACAAAVKWLAERHPRVGYDMRALVSVAAPTPEPVLEADESTQLELPLPTEEVLAEARVANGEYDVVEQPNG